MPVLEEAVSAGREATIEVARIVCEGQPAMASLWNICAAALADFSHSGRFVRRREEFARAPEALIRAATSAMRDALRDVAGARLLTLSHSGSVSRTLISISSNQSIDVVCAESLPGGEGAVLYQMLRGAGVSAEVVPDATLTTYLGSATAVIVGADAVASAEWTNKAGSYGVAAAAWFSGVPVYVVASRDKATAGDLSRRLRVTCLFERTPAQLVTQFLTDIGPVPPDGLAPFANRYSEDLPYLLDEL
jgi:translation initiation factor 2B subunit (eIF-2B alpha/beta/delta family)